MKIDAYDPLYGLGSLSTIGGDPKAQMKLSMAQPPWNAQVRPRVQFISSAISSPDSISREPGLTAGISDCFDHPSPLLTVYIVIE